MTLNNVLRVNTVEEQARYRAAVTKIIRDIMHDLDTNLVHIADRIDVSLGTISNAFNGKSDLCAVYLKRLGEVYGVHFLDPYARLAGGRFVKIDPESNDDILPVIMEAATRIAHDRAPASEGGITETLREKLGQLPYLRRLQREIEAEIHKIENRRAA